VLKPLASIPCLSVTWEQSSAQLSVRQAGYTVTCQLRAVALGDCTPGQDAAIATLVFGDRPSDPNHAPPAEGCWMSSDFFRVSGTPLIRGRFFNSGDNADSTPVVIINEQAARRYWPRENPIGKHIGVNYTGPGRVGTSAPRLREIVGVVQGMKYGSPESLPGAGGLYALPAG
jgi:hypothetical protein